MKLLSSHVIHFLVMGLGMALVMGHLLPTTREDRTRRSVIRHALGLVGIGLLLSWVMYLLPRNLIRF